MKLAAEKDVLKQKNCSIPTMAATGGASPRHAPDLPGRVLQKWTEVARTKNGQ